MFPQIFGKYVLEREIGAGGMARVYLATLRGAGGFEKRLVVKQIRPELASDSGFVRRFVEEAKTAVELSHPNIVPVYELGVERGIYYIAMELCVGVTLSEILARTGVLTPHEGAYVGVEICRALGYAHRRAGIVHRDVTPRNVLVDDEGAVRLIDFGIAAPVTAESAGPREVFGSPGHMPPEQMRGEELTPATDVFAVGVVLVEMLTGKAPFRRSTAEECTRALTQAVPALDTDRPELAPLSPVIAACLALDPGARPQAADDLARPLREFLKSADLGDVAHRFGERVRRARRASRPGPEATAGVTPIVDQRESRPPDSAGDRGSVTRTFAVNKELTVWTRESETGPLTPRAPATADLEGGDPPVTRRLSDPEPTSGDVPTPAPARRGRRGAIGVAVLISALAFGFWKASSAGSPHAPGRASSASPPPGAVEPTKSSAVLRGVDSVFVPEVPKSAPLVATVTAPRVIPSTSAAASGLAMGTLRLTADMPETVVVIDGGGTHRMHRTPFELPVRPGSYTVTFQNQTYPRSLRTVVRVDASATRTVLALFRDAEPHITW